MHIYYFYKDGFYYVMNDNGILEKYSVSNNIDLILKQENLIHYFTKELNAQRTQFRFNTLEELNPLELNKLLEFFQLTIFLQYSILKENTIPIIVIESSILNIINKIYYNKKTTLQAAEIYLEDLLKELLLEFNQKLESLKQISHLKKEVAPLSELDINAAKTYVENINNLINSYKDNIDIELDLMFNPEAIFDNNEYEKMLEYDITDQQELDLQRKIKTTKEKYLKELPKEVQTKLDIFRSKTLIDYLFHFSNGSITFAMILELMKQNLNIEVLNKYQDDILTFIIGLNILSYLIYYRTDNKIKNTKNPILKLEKKDKI